MADAKYLVPDHMPPTREDYDALYAQFIALILSTGKLSMTVPHSIRHPANPNAGVLIVEKRVDTFSTTYTITTELP